MIYGLYHSAAGMMTTEYRQNVIANNLANALTVGFKPDIPVFAERLRASQAGLRDNPTNELHEGLSGGLWLGRTYTDFSDGSIVPSSNPLDVALEGPGFLTVEAGGKQYLTRDGRMIINHMGRLVSAADGAAILNEGGGPISLRRDATTTHVTQDGAITQDGQIVARLGLIDVQDYDALVKAGGGRFVAPDEGRIESSARVHSGATESSAVMAVPTLVSMIEASRAYQINAQMLSLQDSSLSRLIQEVARV